MEGPLFYTETLVNDTHFVKTLIDNNCGSYALISKRYARKVKLDTISIKPRSIERVIASMDGEIREVARVDLDIGGYQMRRVFAYILPGQTDDLILGRPWMQHEFVKIDEKAETLRFTLNGVEVLNIERRKSRAANAILPINHISASTFTGIAKRERKQKEGVQIFAASMADIEKALRPKHRPTKKELLEMLLKLYRQYINVFDPDKADELPLHRPEVDHRIPLEIDEKGRKSPLIIWLIFPNPMAARKY